MYACRLLLGDTFSTEFKIRSFTTINNLRRHGSDSPHEVARSGLDNLNIYVCIACRWILLLPVLTSKLGH